VLFDLDALVTAEPARSTPRWRWSGNCRRSGSAPQFSSLRNCQEEVVAAAGIGELFPVQVDSVDGAAALAEVANRLSTCP